jgi:hypothetical protein
MKNKLFWLVAILSFVPSMASASLYSYYKEQGKILPSVSERTPLATSCGIADYTGSYAQNIALEQCLKGESMLGVALPNVVALFEDSLAQKLNSTATSTFTLVRGTDKQSRALSGRYGLIIDEGTSVEEFIIATCAGTTCTIVTRGLDVADGQSAVAGNQYEHRRGAVVKATDYPQLALITRILNGQDSLENMPYVSSTTFLSTNDAQLTTKYYVDTVGAGGFTSLNVSTTRGLSVDGSSPERVGINASSTLGMTFDTDGALYQSIGNALEYTGNAIAVNTSTIVSQIATSTPTANLIPIADGGGVLDNDWINGLFLGDGSDGALSGTTTLNLASAKVVVKNYTSLSIGAGQTLDFSNPASTGSVIVLKVTGACTIAGTIDGTGTGGANGTGETGATGNGTAGTSGISVKLVSLYGGAGLASVTTVGSAGTFANLASTTSTVTSSFDLLRFPFSLIGAGGGGGSGSGVNAVGGAGGDGAGLLILQCGSLNFTGSIDFSGDNGSDGSGTSGNSKSGGGGGGGGGNVFVLYDTLTASAGTVDVTGGTGGVTGPNGDGGTAYGGGGGGSATSGIIGTTSTGTAAKTGGNGGDGLYYIVENTLYF